jgi:hypothetical protein
MVVCVCMWLSPMWPVYVVVADVARDVARVAVALWLDACGSYTWARPSYIIAQVVCLCVLGACVVV